ncbi:YicC/YloC family endoribonuclease [Bacillus horti]|uniref:Uncharacterized protein (TIGR00255 family) n=1 Tax=Caldalkalibacillus horti TaxID=77523 RepID=A0ABT9VXJ0_9BACI|nr:YicC/YloC family endoribonuclease [Bacillus horti]MDQ0165693.1 uncharacterized protein (TIGR00255 family) [Bacillus horti]
MNVVSSMTGYGRYETVWQDMKITVEMKSVNHRFCEIIIRSPKQLMLFEEAIKRKVQAHLKRGRVEVYVTCDTNTLVDKKLQVDWELAEAMLQAALELQNKLGLEGKLTIQDLLQREELFRIEEDVQEMDEAFSHTLLEAVTQASLQLKDMREQEGQRLAEDLHTKLRTVNEHTDIIKKLAPQMKEIYAEKLEVRLKQFLEQRVEIDESRFLTEIGVFAEKVDIDEELTRLASHTVQFEQFLGIKDEAIGRKLDFLVQEMNREVNTIGSKANDISIRQKVIELKNELEKIKEQVQNLE